MATPRSPKPKSPLASASESDNESLIRRSWHAMSDLFSPFSPAALASLPKNARRTKRYHREDAIPDDVESDEQGRRPMVSDYHSINPVGVNTDVGGGEGEGGSAGGDRVIVRVPKKVATPVRVEGKVWFANERTWIAWLNLCVLLGTLSLAFFNASKDQVARNFAYFYALISVGVLLYAYALYQRRITMIRRRDPGTFDDLKGPVIVSLLLFLGIAANFVIRIRELHEKNIPIPGSSIIPQLAATLRYGMVPRSTNSTRM